GPPKANSIALISPRKRNASSRAPSPCLATITAAIQLSREHTVPSVRIRTGHKRIDLVRNPILRHQSREQHSHQPQTPPPSSPRISKGRELHRNVRHVRTAIAEIREHRQDGHRDKRLPRQRRTEMRPRAHDPNHHHRRKNSVVNGAPPL